MQKETFIRKVFEENDVRALIRLPNIILGEVEVAGQLYTYYVLQDRIFKNSIVIQEMLIVESNPKRMEQLKKNQISIYQYFDQLSKFRIAKIGERLFKEPLSDLVTIEGRFPKPTILLNLKEKQVS